MSENSGYIWYIKLEAIFVSGLDKMLFNPKVLIFFLFLHENICCGYSLEAPCRGASDE